MTPAADAGFLGFPALALVGLLVRQTSGAGQHRRSRALLDGLLVAASLFVLSWMTALGQVYQAGADSAFAAVVSMAYPVADLLLLTLTLVVVSHARGNARQGLGLLAAGFAAFSVGDSGFAYLTATGEYHTGNLIDVGWVLGFAILGELGEDGSTLAERVMAALDVPVQYGRSGGLPVRRLPHRAPVRDSAKPADRGPMCPRELPRR